MAIGVRAGARINRDEELNTRFILKEFGAERVAYRLQWVREPHLLTDIAQSNANLLAPGSARRRYVVLDGVPPNVLGRGHGWICEIRWTHRPRTGTVLVAAPAGYFAAVFLRSAQEAVIRSETAFFSSAVIGRRFLVGLASDAVSATGVAAAAGRRHS